MTRREHVWIPMDDGVRLAATLYYPAPGPDGGGPWPALLEALPYRKEDVTASYRPEYQRLAEAGSTRAASMSAARAPAKVSPRTSTPRSNAPTS